MDGVDGGPLQVLLVEDDDGDALLVEELLTEAHLTLDLTRAWSLEAALDALTVPVDCVLLDLGLPDATGLDALLRLRQSCDAAVVVLTGLDDIDRGVEAVAAGAQDYLVKGRVEGEALGRALRYAVERRRAERERSREEDAAQLDQRLAEVVRRLRHAVDVPAGLSVSTRGGLEQLLSTALWDVISRADGSLLVLFGAVSDDDGAAAVAHALRLRTGLRALAGGGLDLEGLVAALDRLAFGGPASRALLVELDLERQQIAVVGAGHAPPWLVGPAGVRQLVEADTAALGEAVRPRDITRSALADAGRLLLVDVAPGGAVAEMLHHDLPRLAGQPMPADVLADAVLWLLPPGTGPAEEAALALLDWAGA